MTDLTREKVVEFIKGMTVLELNELVKTLEEEFGVSAAAAMMPAAAAAGGGGTAEEEEEKTAFDVVLTGIGEKKINVIKVVREVTTLGLKEAKDLVDNVPGTVKEAISKDEAAEIKKKFEDVGATVEIK